MILLKLGGSLITDKTKKFSIRKKVLERVAAEIKAGAKEKLVIVHGGGSFGHPVAARYKLQEGFKNKEQIAGIALTRSSMAELNRHVMSSLIKYIPAVSIQPSANIICKNGRISQINLEIIKRFIELGNVPVLYGDVVLDFEQGFCILSGDQIVSYLAEVFRPSKIIIAADVGGIFDRDPKKSKNAKLISEINPGNAVEVLEKLDGGDVTGGIKGKLLELTELANKGFESWIINALEKGRLKKALLANELIGTRIKRGRYDKFKKT